MALYPGHGASWSADALAWKNWGGKQLLNSDFLFWSTTLVTPSAEINPTPLRGTGMPARWGYGRLWWVWDDAVYPGGTSMGPYQGAYSAMGSGGQFITVFPSRDLVIVHKVDIDADDQAQMSALGYDAVLEMVLDAQCGEKLPVAPSLASRAPQDGAEIKTPLCGKHSGIAPL